VKIEPTALPEVLVVAPDVHRDPRGHLVETWSAARYAAAGLGAFVQDNLVRSLRGALRGLHLQHPFAQGKLVWAVAGEVFDVAVDVRVGSPTFGRWVGVRLSGDDHRQLWVPPGFAHGLCALSEVALCAYKCTEVHHPEAALGVAWDDPDLGIRWPVDAPVLSPGDRANPRLGQIDPRRLPRYPGAGSE
jgi:dTDP-4-dehydrorhamnose 3,5-epimerase